MRKISIYFLLILFGLFIGCSKDDDAVDPAVNDPVTELELITTIQIDNAGGQLIIDDFELTVPEGSFSSNQELKLYKISQNESFDESEASTFYQVSGLPSNYSNSFTLKVKTNVELSEQTLIALGEKNYISSLDTVASGFQLLPTTLEGEWASAEIPVLETEGKGKGEETELLFGVVTGYKESDSKGHFKVYFPKGLEDKATLLGQFLENAYEFYQSPPMGFSYNNRTSWPVSVTIKKLGVHGYYENSKLGNNYGFMMFNSEALNNEAELKITAGHEFFHLVQSLYDPRLGFVKAISGGPFVWFDEACSAWAEEKFSEQAGYTSPTRSENEMAVLNGAQVGASGDPAAHGYGMSTLIKYLVNKPTIGEEVLLKVYEKHLSGTSNPLSALNSVLPDPTLLDNYYADLINDYILEEVYDDVSPAFWVGGRHGSFTINEPTDTLKLFGSDYPHYSAKVFQVKLQNPELTDDHTLEFKATGGSGRWLMVYKYNSSLVQKLSEGYDDVIINDIKGLKDGGWNLFAVVVNTTGITPYNGSNSIELKISLLTGEPISSNVNFDLFSVDFSVRATIYNELFDESNENSNGLDMYSYFSFPDTIKATLSGNNYSASWDFVGENDKQQVGHFSFEIDFVQGKIVQGEFVSNIYWLAGSSQGDYLLRKVKIQDVPFIEEWDDELYFGISGTDLSSHITEFTWHKYLQPDDPYGIYMTSYECTENSYFSLNIGYQY